MFSVADTGMNQTTYSQGSCSLRQKSKYVIIITVTNLAVLCKKDDGNSGIKFLNSR